MWKQSTQKSDRVGRYQKQCDRQGYNSPFLRHLLQLRSRCCNSKDLDKYLEAQQSLPADCPQEQCCNMFHQHPNS